MITQEQLSSIRGATVFDSDGDKIGKAGEVYLDDRTGEPSWVTVNTGLFGSHESFVPLESAAFEGDEVRVPYAKSQVKDAPRVAADGHLDLDEEDRLYEYYGLSGGQTGRTGVGTTGRTEGFDETTTGTTRGFDETTTGTARSDGFDETTTGTNRTEGYDESRSGTGRARFAEGRDVSGPTTDDAMTRSEEELRVGTQTREAGRARLRKWVETERQTTTVPVSHEEVRLEREPVTAADRDAAYDGPAISEEEHEVTLHEEVPVVAKEAHPVERVRLGTETVTGEQEVSGDVRKERVEVENGVEGVEGTGRRGTTDRLTGDRTDRDI